MQLQARLSIRKESSNDPLFYSEDLEQIKKLNLSLDKLEPWRINIGTKVNFEGLDYSVKSVNLEIYEDTDVSNYGIEIYRTGKKYPYNIKIIVIVEG